MFRSFCNVLGVSAGSSTSISLAARLRAGIVTERAVGDACEGRVSGTDGDYGRRRGIADGAEDVWTRKITRRRGALRRGERERREVVEQGASWNLRSLNSGIARNGKR
jgi:hypothetical protein